jgi:hypothetical protein
MPLTQSIKTEMASAVVKGNGMNAALNERVHCVAAEPHTTFLRIRVTDGGEEVAYEVVVLGRLLSGYRVLQLRSMLGTRIELCHLFVRIVATSVLNLWSTDQEASSNRSLWPCTRLWQALGSACLVFTCLPCSFQIRLSSTLLKENEALKQELAEIQRLSKVEG